ncbi:Glutathione reductase, chloroplastic (Fragment) [Seminavis robusta]|uniref:Trypanothione reductase n=1 Tax=Seminavis robusta TaxID=568900 RepID=A0A9N8EKB7_9STRA
MKLLGHILAMATLIARRTVAFAPLRRGLRTASSLRSSTEEEYDLVVIGGGSGGVRASRISAGYGKKVAILEPQLNHGAPNYSAIGGTCVNVGCVPKKLMVFASRYPGMIAESSGYGWENASPGQFKWKTFMEYKDAEITRLNNVYQKFVLGNAGVEIIEGKGSLEGTNTVHVHAPDGSVTRTLHTKNTIIAVGGWPNKPSIPGIEHAITSNEIFYLKEQPKRIVCVGGGFIALEFAQIMDGLGSDVTLMYRGELFLRGFDQDMRELLRDEMTENSNIDLQFNTNPAEIIKNADGSLTVVTEDGKRVETDAILMATGRNGNIDGLNLESAGVQTDGSFIPVNEYSRTNVDNIYAVGDVTDRIALTPVALMEGHRLADTLFGGMDRPVDHEFVASTVFTTPEIATIGYTEEQAAEKFKDITVYKTKFRPMAHSFPKSETYTLFKIIVDTKTDKVVGVHLATDSAGEVMQGVAVAVKMGATKADFDVTIGIHPTSAEELVTMRSPSYHYVDGKKVE